MTNTELNEKIIPMAGDGRSVIAGVATDRDSLTAKITGTKIAKGIKWADVADMIGQSKEWTTAACLGQMTMTKDEAETVAGIFDLNDMETLQLQVVPFKGSLPDAIPTDPLIYRFYEITQVYGTTLKALIEEEFGDGIMSAIDFTMDIDRKEDPKGDRVIVTLNGKFLPYKKW
jgi:cyanate lyase